MSLDRVASLPRLGSSGTAPTKCAISLADILELPNFEDAQHNMQTNLATRVFGNDCWSFYCMHSPEVLVDGTLTYPSSVIGHSVASGPKSFSHVLSLSLYTYGRI